MRNARFDDALHGFWDGVQKVVTGSELDGIHRGQELGPVVLTHALLIGHEHAHHVRSFVDVRGALPRAEQHDDLEIRRRDGDALANARKGTPEYTASDDV